METQSTRVEITLNNFKSLKNILSTNVCLAGMYKSDVHMARNDLVVHRPEREYKDYLSQQEEVDFESLYENKFFESI